MIDFFTTIYSSIKDRNGFLKKVRFYSLQRAIIRILANFIIPVYLRLTAQKKKIRLSFSEEKDKKVIVSLTSFPARISRVWVVIECLLRQTYRPDKIILWLSKEQFGGYDDLPQTLLKLQNRGLEINFCDGDLRSHKKYYYSMKSFPNDVIITVDDDIIYPTSLIEELMELHEKYPNVVCCARASQITREGPNIKSYKEWGSLNGEEGPSFDIFFTSGGGTLFPPGALSKEVLNKKVFMNNCKYADDIWLNIMSRMNNTKTIKADIKNTILPILNKGDTNLTSINVKEGLNDKQLNDVRNYYRNKGFDPLKVVEENEVATC